MRWLATLLVVVIASSAAAHEGEPGQSRIVEQPAPAAAPTPAPTTAATSTSTPIPTLTLTPRATSIMAERWHRARVLYGVGSFIGLGGSALSLSSALVAIISGYPCNPLDPTDINCAADPPAPTDAVPLLGYLGSTVSAFGFVLAASGLGYQHALLSDLNADIGRGVFAGGTLIGLLGFVSVGMSYVFGLTQILENPQDQGIAIFTTSMTGTALCLLGGLLYTIDAGRMKRAWQRVSSF